VATKGVRIYVELPKAGCGERRIWSQPVPGGLVLARAAQWLEVKKREAKAGDRGLSPKTRWNILDAIPEDRRGIYLALALMGLRPGEAVALDVADDMDRPRSVRPRLRLRPLAGPRASPPPAA
jgi:integrase